MLTPSQLSRGTERAFCLGGNATFTLVSRVTGQRFTYQVSQSKPKPGGGAPVWFVSVLTGPNNSDDYSYAGIINPEGVFRQTAKSRLSSTAPSVVAFAWFWRNVDKLPAQVEVWHSGHCCRCGRQLTDPESIASGWGPICRERAA
jgi:hypothetical protein